MGQNLANVDAVLMEFYDGPLRSQLNDEVEMFDLLDENEKPWSGRRVVGSVKLTRNSGVGARSESQALPTAGKQGTVETRVSACYHYGRFELTGQVLAATKHAFVEGLALEMDGLRDDMIDDAGRISYGDGNGTLCKVAADSHSSSSITVNNKYAAPGNAGARYIMEGEEVNFALIASATNAGQTATVISVTIAANSGTTTDTITVSATAMDVCSTHFVFRKDAGGAGIEPIGVRGLVDDITATGLYGAAYFSASKLQNVDRSVYSKWNANVLHNCSTGRLIEGKLIQRAFSKQKIASGKKVNIIMGEYFVVDEFLDHVSSDRRYNSSNYDAGERSLSWNGVNIRRDVMAPYNELFLWDKPALKKYTLEDYRFADEDGKIMKNIAGYDKWEGFMKAYYNYGIDQPRACTVLRDLIDE